MDQLNHPTPSIPHFHHFPLLPTELRLKIYNHILALSLSTNATSTNREHSSTDKETYARRSPPPPHPEDQDESQTPNLELHPQYPRRILKISYVPSSRIYIANVAPPILLSISRESRHYTLQSHAYTHLALSSGASPSPLPLIPISHSLDTLYISSLLPALLSPSPSDLLYALCTSPSRHTLRSLALDLRVWHELCAEGMLGVLAGMRGLKEVNLVVEFGRREFKGEIGFLETPEWREDLKWVERREEEGLEAERERARVRMRERVGKVRVRCVLLTRGGEQA